MDKGAWIRIKNMEGEPRYTGAIGQVEHIDSIGQIHGTWGGCAIQPERDSYEVISEETAKAILKAKEDAKKAYVPPVIKWNKEEECVRYSFMMSTVLTRLQRLNNEQSKLIEAHVEFWPNGSVERSKEYGKKITTIIGIADNEVPMLRSFVNQKLGGIDCCYKLIITPCDVRKDFASVKDAVEVAVERFVYKYQMMD